MDDRLNKLESGTAQQGDASHGEKPCPFCAETIKAKAVVCKHCGRDLYTSGASPRKSAATDGGRTPESNLLRLGIAGIAFLGLTYACRQQPTDNLSAASMSAVLMSGEQRKGCGDVIAKQMLSGLVRDRPSPNRINVNELLWARLPAGEKEALLALVACDAFGKQAADLDIMEFTVAYGWRSGRRLAMLNSAGMSFE